MLDLECCLHMDHRIVCRNPPQRSGRAPHPDCRSRGSQRLVCRHFLASSTRAVPGVGALSANTLARAETMDCGDATQVLPSDIRERLRDRLTLPIHVVQFPTLTADAVSCIVFLLPCSLCPSIAVSTPRPPSPGWEERKEVREKEGALLSGRRASRRGVTLAVWARSPAVPRCLCVRTRCPPPRGGI